MTSHTLGTRHGGIKLVLTWKTPVRGLPFTVSEDAMQASKGENISIFLPSCDTYEPKQWPAWQNILKDVIVTLMLSDWIKT